MSRIDERFNSLLVKHPDLSESFKGSNWSEIYKGLFPDRITVPVLDNILTYAKMRGYLKDDAVLLQKEGVLTYGAFTLVGWEGHELVEGVVNTVEPELLETLNEQETFEEDSEKSEEEDNKPASDLRRKSVEKSSNSAKYIFLGVASLWALGIGYMVWSNSTQGGANKTVKPHDKNMTLADMGVGKRKTELPLVSLDKEKTEPKKAKEEPKKISVTTERKEATPRKETAEREDQAVIVATASTPGRGSNPALNQQAQITDGYPKQGMSKPVGKKEDSSKAEEPKEEKPQIETPKEDTGKGSDETPIQPTQPEQPDTTTQPTDTTTTETPAEPSTPSGGENDWGGYTSEPDTGMSAKPAVVN